MEKHDTLLISSASTQNRAHLRHVLGEGFNLLEAVNISQAFLLLRQNIGCIAAVLLDASTEAPLDEGVIRQPENMELLREVVADAERKV